MPQAPLVRLPVVGLPPQATVQSTPRLFTSFDGFVLRESLEPIERTLAGAVSPLAFVIVIGAAVAVPPDVEPLPPPQPAMMTSSNVVTPPNHKRLVPFIP